MKLTFKQIEPFVQNPDKAARVVLVYGPDQGLMSERAKTICHTVVNDLHDPFNVVIFNPDQILSDNALFFDETQAQSMMGGQRLILIRQGADSLHTLIKSYLENASDETLVVIEAGDLGARSSLRKLCETSKNAAAVPCYVDDEGNLSSIIRDMCMHAGYAIDRDALQTYASALVGDRAIARNEIEKLIIYKGFHENYKGFEGNPLGQKIGTITIDDIMACSGDIRDWSMDTLIYAVADGNLKAAHSITESLFRDQVVPIVIIRSVQNHFWRLYSTKSKMANGQNIEQACKALTPPLFWKVQNAFKSQLSRWTLPALESALDALNKAEVFTKKSGYDAESITEQCLTQLCRYNPHRRAA
jgi:DNA polymerase-3 subunit delta